MSNKFAFPGGSIFNKNGSHRLGTTIFYYGTVVSNTDEFGASRIRVRIIGEDDESKNSELPYAFPMIQKFMHVIPKVNETVLVFIPDVKNSFIDRMYVGPIISQPQKLNNDSEPYSSRSTLDSKTKEPQASPDTVPESKGVYPKVEDIAFQGRNNSDLIFRDEEAIIRAGQFDSQSANADDIPVFNKINPSYIQLSHNVVLKKATETELSGRFGKFNKTTEEERGGAINIVSNKINLLTHKNGSPRFELNNQDETITETELQRILKEAHPLPFGDKLIEYLILQRAAFSNHVHSYPGEKAQDLSGANDIDKYLDFNLESMLSKNIRIN
jgi:hypothetical protein